MPKAAEHINRRLVLSQPDPVVAIGERLTSAIREFDKADAASVMVGGRDERLVEKASNAEREIKRLQRDIAFAKANSIDGAHLQLIVLSHIVHWDSNNCLEDVRAMKDSIIGSISSVMEHFSGKESASCFDGYFYFPTESIGATCRNN